MKTAALAPSLLRTATSRSLQIRSVWLVVDWQLPTALVDLDVTPVAIYEGRFEPEDAALTCFPELHLDALEGVPRIGTFDSPSVEKLAELDPDLILTAQATVDDSLLDQLDDVAPTVQLSTEGNWLDLQERASEVLSHHDVWLLPS